MLTRFETPLDRCNLKFGETGVDAVTNGLFEGYASTFGNIDSFGDTIMQGAFTTTLEERQFPILMLYGHSTGRAPIGKWLDMQQDDKGLYVWGEITPGNTDASNIYASMKHGSLTGLSIGFRIPVGGAEEIEGGGRRITQVNLEEVSVVAFPADAEARVAVVKSEIEAIESLRDCEHFLRDAGFSRAMAKAFISQCRPLYQREADLENERKEAHQADLEWLRKLTE